MCAPGLLVFPLDDIYALAAYAIVRVFDFMDGHAVELGWNVHDLGRNRRQLFYESALLRLAEGACFDGYVRRRCPFSFFVASSQ